MTSLVCSRLSSPTAEGPASNPVPSVRPRQELLEASPDLHRPREALAVQGRGPADVTEARVAQVDAFAAGVQPAASPDFAEDDGARQELRPTGEDHLYLG